MTIKVEKKELIRVKNIMLELGMQKKDGVLSCDN